MCAYYSKACRLSETIQTEIQQGRLFNNPYFPSEIQLAARYCASRHTVRRILAKLTDDGILIRMDNGRVKISPSVEENISINPGKSSWPGSMQRIPTPRLQKSLRELSTSPKK